MMMMMMVVVKSISSFLVALRLAAGGDDDVRARREKLFFWCVFSSRGKSTHKKEGISADKNNFLSKFSKDGVWNPTTTRWNVNKKSFSCSHVCSVRDRRHRFPSLIDAFLSVHDRFHFRFDRFLDRFRFLKHDDLVSLLLLLPKESQNRMGIERQLDSLSLLLSIFFTHTQKTRVVVPQKKMTVASPALFLSLSLSMRVYGFGRKKRERLKWVRFMYSKCVDELTQKQKPKQAHAPFFMKP